MYIVGLLAAVIVAAGLMAYAFVGLVFAKTQRKISLAIALATGSVCAFAVLAALLINASRGVIPCVSST